MLSLLLPVLLSLLRAPAALAEVCPADEDLSPCLCDDNDLDFDIVVACTDGSQPELKRAFESLRGKKDLAVELAFLVLGGLPDNFFRDIHVKKLSLTSCELEGLAAVQGRPALLGLEDSLEKLEIFRSLGKYKKILAINLGHLRRLQTIELTDNSIDEIGNDWFQNGPVSLVELILSNNDIQVLGDRAFQSLTNLKYLKLEGNRFGNFKRSMLPSPASNLYTLDFSQNQFSDLPEDMFIEMPSLKEVILHTNSIHRLSLTTWKPVWKQLDGLLIDENPLECDAELESVLKLGKPEVLEGHCKGPLGREGQQLKDITY